jgi:hypothetical protein
MEKVSWKGFKKKNSNVHDYGCVNNFCILSADKQQFFCIINAYHFYGSTKLLTSKQNIHNESMITAD